MRHISAKSLINWIVAFPVRDEQVSLAFIDALLQVCKPFGKIFNIYLFFFKIHLLLFFNRNAN